MGGMCRFGYVVVGLGSLEDVVYGEGGSGGLLTRDPFVLMYRVLWVL